MVGSIDPVCEKIRGTHWPVKVAGVFGTRIAENHLGQRSTKPHQQAGHMDASDPIRPSKNSCGRGPSTYGSRISARCAHLSGTTLKVWHSRDFLFSRRIAPEL